MPSLGLGLREWRGPRYCQPYADAPQKGDGLLMALNIERAPLERGFDF